MDKKTAVKVGLVVVMVMMVLSAGIAFAQDDEEGGGEEKKESSGNVFTLINHAAPVSYVLILLSCIGTALAIQYGMLIKVEKTDPPALMMQVEEIVNSVADTSPEEWDPESNPMDDIMATCDSFPESYYGKIVAGAMSRVEGGHEEMLRGIDESAASASFHLQGKVSNLGLVGNLGPLIGLLGTVTGMISSFRKIEGLKSPTPADLATGVYESLVNTTLGLIVAVAFLTVNFFFKNKVTRDTIAMNGRASELIGRLQPAIPQLQELIRQQRQAAQTQGQEG